MIKSSGDKNIEDLLLGSVLYKVPLYQRSFSWEKEQVERFWEDIIETISEERTDYFIGSIIFKENPDGTRIIIDGQQRLAVITIIFACIRDMFNRLGDVAATAEIETRYIGMRDIETRQRDFKLKLNKEDEDFFRDYIQSAMAEIRTKRFGKKSGKPQSHKLIIKAYEVLNHNISDELEKYKDLDSKKRFLYKLTSIIAKKFKVIATYVDNENDAYLIFETLNERGLDLSIADLLKNYIYSKAGKKQESVQKQWEGIASVLSGSDLVDFLRYYWSSSRELVRDKQLYRVLRNHLREQQDVYQFVSDLKKEAEVYEALINPNENFWDINQFELLKELKILNVKQIYPLLLSGDIRLNKSDFTKLLNLSLNLTFRYSTICNLNPNKLERCYSDLSIKLRTGRISFCQIQRELTKLNPDDESLIKAFNLKEIKNTQIARYVLAQITNYIMKKDELSVVRNPEKVNLEHIIPKTLNSDWEKYIKKQKLEHKELINMIGNLTLLSKPQNIQASNKLFLEKCKETYRKSNLPITKELCRYKIWNKDTILERQEKLANLAKNIWKI